MELLFKLAIFTVLVLIGYFRGRVNQLKHLKDLALEEQAQRDVLIFATRHPASSSTPLDPILVTGNAVVSADYFRYFIAGLRKFLGGNYTVFEELNERARRQAIVRMKQAAKQQGAQMIFNVCINANRISHPREPGAPQVEIIAYGTAFIPAKGSIESSDAHYFNPHPTSLSEPYEMLEHPYPRAWLLGWMITVFVVMTAFVASPWHTQDLSWRAITLLIPAAALTVFLHYLGQKKGVPSSKCWMMSTLSLPTLFFLLHYMVVAAQVILLPAPQPTLYEWRNQGELHPISPAESPLIHLVPAQRRKWKDKPVETRVYVEVREGWMGGVLWREPDIPAAEHKP